MTIYLTRKQYDMLAKMVPIMLECYKNNIRPLFEEIGWQYGTQAAVDTACEIFKAVPVTGRVPKYIKALAGVAAIDYGDISQERIDALVQAGSNMEPLIP